jgi:diadenosine tetraphosphatase ApaH/serine/threonine PP2A family protein phosphatase
LDAVLADAAKQQVTDYCFLGDLVDGHDPSGVLERITPLPNAGFIAGNTENYIIKGKGHSALTPESIKQKPERLMVFQEATASWAWTKGWLCATGWFDWLSTLPIEYRVVLPNNARLFCVHASPGYADGPGVGPHTSDEELVEMTAGCQADIVCVAHTHVAFVRQVGEVMVINPGPVSNPLAPDLRAAYAILEVNLQQIEVIHRRVEYDHEAVIKAVQQSHHPAARFIIDHQHGNRTVEDMMAAAKARRHMIRSQ